MKIRIKINTILKTTKTLSWMSSLSDPYEEPILVPEPLYQKLRFHEHKTEKNMLMKIYSKEVEIARDKITIEDGRKGFILLEFNQKDLYGSNDDSIGCDYPIKEFSKIIVEYSVGNVVYDISGAFKIIE